ncbi:hypothetical protein [Sorangium cellulosum]|uniref:Uncharacterized protein n=2 Tax=Sorangium cellulosum TaxID=56 RepID=A0A150TPW2_SORCE|nr:hypothetical protein [Sorangium cellulosum]AGP34650.1 hypothetical protein SCE1572_09090 [Sorangium cellulosum So0157-2]KYG06741.1 hypothetical protein BE21_33075 [Sorangium cellulosum]
MAPIAVNVRSGAYDYGICAHLNEGDGTCAAADQAFLDWAFGVYDPADALSFEGAPTDAGFIACADPSAPGRVPLDCGP